jgi:Photosynthetic reaction centre cytochrome C subunit
MTRIAATALFMLMALVPVVARPRNQPPSAVLVDTPGVKVLTGLTVPEFEAEMNTMAAALGVSCGSCHARGNFASESNPRKAVARRMLEMTKGLNQQFFPDYKPADGESRIGRVTCYTCHQGAERPKTAPPQ